MPKKNSIKIIYEDKDIVVIDKPTGISVHGDGRTEEYTVADWVIENYPKLKNVGEPLIVSDEREVPRPGIVHRLDKGTSGIMIIAKRKEIYKYLKRQFSDRNIKKVYRALVHGDFKDDNGMIDKPIGKSGSDFRAKATGSSAKGEMREAMTYYKVLERFPGYSYLELRPKTGRTHQIRVHLKSIGKPIVCDEIYAKGKIRPKWMERLALHAFSLELPLPGGEMKKFEAPLPKDIMDGLNILRKEQ